MDRRELQKIWAETLGSPDQTVANYDRLAQSLLELYESGSVFFKQHIRNRFDRVTEATGQAFDEKSFDLAMARAFVADEIGFASWGELMQSIEHPGENKYPVLFRYAIAALWRGDFTSLERMVGGPDAFDDRIIEWYEKGYFADEPETLAEAFAAACMLGHDRSAAYLLDKGVDPYAGMRTGLAGFHYASSSGRLNVTKLLIERKVPMEIENMYGGTVLGQALWSAINEHGPDHGAIIEALLEAGAYVWPNTLEWWNEQEVPSAETKKRVADALRLRIEQE